MCRLCGLGVESGSHLTFDCLAAAGSRGWSWSGWEELDDPVRWRYEYEEGGKTRTGDRVEDYFDWIDGRLCGVG